MSLVDKTRVSIFKNFFVSLLLAVLLNSFFISVASAENFMVSSGVDNTADASTPLSASDITKINTSDDSRFQNNSITWPAGESYDESKYIEFIFAPNIPENAIINEVYLTHEFRRSGALTGAKLEVWDGSTFQDEVLTTGSINTDHTDITPTLTYLDTPEKINNLAVRFLAYRGVGGNTKTSHDFLGLTVNYSLLEGEEDDGSNSSTLILNDITEDTTWTKLGSPYVVNEDISIMSGVTLTIEPGVVVEFNSGIFFVEGVLKAIGSAEDPIYLNGFTDLVIASLVEKSILNHVVNRSNLIVLYEGGSVVSDGLDTDQDILMFQSKSTFDNLKTSGLNLFDHSEVSINSAIIVGEDSGFIEVQNGSNLSLKNSKIESSGNSSLINIFDRASATFDKVEIVSTDEASSNISVFTDSSLTLKDSLATGSRNGIEVYNNSSVDITNLDLNCSHTGISVYNSSTLDLDGGNISCDYDGLVLFNEIKADISNTKISEALDGGIVAFNNTDPEAINITLSEITNNLYGFIVFDSTFNAHKNNIHNNIFMGVDTFSEIDLDFKNNYWGDATGPYHLDFNPDGLGDSIGEHILFYPWLSSWPPREICENCPSNVMFFPGIQGSRMYGEVFDCSSVTPRDPMFCGEQQLWISPHKVLQEFMFLDEFGKSKNNVYTKNDTESIDGDGIEKGVVDEAFTVNVYKSFIEDLKTLKEDEIINNYALIPYDWRLSLEDIITNGKVIGENLSYIENQDFSESFILEKLRELEKSSKSGKVTLIAHSTGGLVIKALVQKLKDTNDPLYEKIDKIIFVAVPQVGTPEATIAMLHGIPLGYGILMPSERSRELGENMPTMYNLAPSSAFFDTVNANLSPIITFPDHDLFKEQIEKYGNSIDTKAELKDFVLGGDGRSKPRVDDTDKPNIVNEYLYTQAENIHEIIDSWQPSVNTKIIEVAGWGEETKAGLKYVVKTKAKSFSVYEEYISYKPIKVIDGDSTVVFPSALWMENNENIEEWFVNLKKWNKGDFILRDNHKNILEIKNVRDFIDAKIKNIFSFSDSENIVVNNRSSLISEGKRLHFTLHSPLTLGITDPEGRYTGLDPDTGEIKEEIPDVTYEQIGEVQFLSIPEGVEYTLKLDGYEEGSFTLDVESQEGNDIIEENYFEAIPTSDKTLAFLDIGEDFKVLNAVLRVDTDGDGDIDEVYPKIEEEVIEDIKTVASPHGAVILPKNDNIIANGSLAFLENIGQVLGLETKEEVTREIKEPENNQEKVFIEKETSQNIEVESIPQEENKEEAPIDVLKEKDTNKNTPFYVIILSILALSFIIKRFILI